MSRSLSQLPRVSVIALFLVAWSPAAFGQATATQTLDLQPGWNAVFLEVEPEPNDPGTLFAGLPVESVWAWFDRGTSVQFIRSPAEQGWDEPGWGVFFPAPDKAFLSNLHAVHGGKAYLIKLGGTDPVTWTVDGEPQLRSTPWVSDSFNLVGFAVDPANAPTFAAYFAPSPAHRGQAVYRLTPDGQWHFVDDLANETIRAGVAYWVYCEGSSRYRGPLELTVSLGDLDFGAILDQEVITLVNLRGVAVSATLTASPGVPLTYRDFNHTTGFYEWLPLDGIGPVALEPGRHVGVRLGVRREQMAAGTRESVLEVNDGAGARLLLPVRVEKN